MVNDWNLHFTRSGEPFMVMIYHTLESVEKTLSIQSHYRRIIGVSDHLLSVAFRFNYHSQKVIGSLRKINQQDLAKSSKYLLNM